MLNHTITKLFYKKIDEIFKENHELIKFFKNHERKDLLIENLTAKIRQEEILGKYSFTRKNIEDIVHDFTVMFCETCIKHKQEQLTKKAVLFKSEGDEDGTIIID
jgi:hypothetical protein